jgi:predicted transcriptional regulator
MPKKKHSEIRLGRLETRIMNVVWDRGSATVREVKDALWKSKKLAYSTVLTMMRKLEEKGYLLHDVRDRTYVYRATIDQQDVRRNLLADLVNHLFDGSPSLLVNILLQQDNINDAEVSEIKKLIRMREKQNE